MEIEQRHIPFIICYKETDPDLTIQASCDMSRKNGYKKIKKVFLCFKKIKNMRHMTGIKECFLFDAEKSVFKRYYIAREQFSKWMITQRKVITDCIDLEPWQIERFEEFFKLISKNWNEKTVECAYRCECELVVIYKDDSQWSFSCDIDNLPYNFAELIGLFFSLEMNDSLMKGEQVFCKDFDVWNIEKYDEEGD